MFVFFFFLSKGDLLILYDTAIFFHLSRQWKIIISLISHEILAFLVKQIWVIHLAMADKILS